ncbi:transcriptional regulator [Pullulanibacillus sp. KACC 23026]|uniref:transcriptional regulator n=1 Tax=Pullulanibacillus sp. KACC 23026 TaxID=3028315 RepID=UPI0023B0A166|nr:transcriptional regulator [Pullulanibacillus sp. KACC 23026]WEG12928.1 transcriptional regulator [Pullulanibacillus sp. KACC 23026]
MSRFDEAFQNWLEASIQEEKNLRRRERLKSGLGHGSMTFLKHIWYPVVGNFDHLYAEWEVKDFHNGYRYLDFAYMPGNVRGGIEIQGYGPHAKDLDKRRFKDLCMRHSLLALDGWIFIPIAYPSIIDEPKFCEQLVLSFIGKFLSTDIPIELSWLEAEIVRFARRLLRPITPKEVADHLGITPHYARRLLNKLTTPEYRLLKIASGNLRIRTYRLNLEKQNDLPYNRPHTKSVTSMDITS